MAFNIYKTNDRIKDTGTLHNGDKTLDISVDISASQIQGQYIALIQRLSAAQTAAAKANREKNLEAFAEANTAVSGVIAQLFFLIFGEDQTEKILQFYEDDPYLMLADFVPYFQDEISPKIRKAQEKRARMYKR